MNILTLDLSLSSTGYSIYSNGKIIECNRIVSDKKEITQKTKRHLNYYFYVGTESEDERLYHLMIAIEHLINYYNITDIVLESGFIGSNRKVGLTLSKIKGAVIYIAKLNGCNLTELTPSQIRKFIFGKGNVDKEVVGLYVKRNYLDVGEFSDKTGKSKTSDMYDALAILIAFCIKNDLQLHKKED